VDDQAPIQPKGKARRRTIGVVVAVAVHVALFAGLIVSIVIPRLPTAPEIQVSLIPAWRVEPRPARKPPTPPPPKHEREIAPRAAKIVGPEPVTPLPIAPAPPDAATRERLLAAPFAQRGSVGQALRAATGCAEADWLKLSPAERAACRQRAHDQGAGAPIYAVGPSDPSQRLYLDRQAAKNEKRRLQLEAPPTAPMVACSQGRWQNLGFSCPP
jgi:hypothetical protein